MWACAPDPRPSAPPHRGSEQTARRPCARTGSAPARAPGSWPAPPGCPPDPAGPATAPTAHGSAGAPPRAAHVLAAATPAASAAHAAGPGHPATCGSSDHPSCRTCDRCGFHAVPADEQDDHHYDVGQDEQASTQVALARDHGGGDRPEVLQAVQHGGDHDKRPHRQPVDPGRQVSVCPAPHLPCCSLLPARALFLVLKCHCCPPASRSGAATPPGLVAAAGGSPRLREHL